MSEVDQIEKRIEGLSREDLANFREWFLDFDAAVWDRQIEADSEAGRLDSLIAEATADYEAGKARDLCGLADSLSRRSRCLHHLRVL